MQYTLFILIVDSACYKRRYLLSHAGEGWHPTSLFKAIILSFCLFYKKPNKNEAFAKNRNLLQLNMVNDVLPEFISLALGRDTKRQRLNERDLAVLEAQGIAKRWVGTRAVAYDGFPTVGSIYNSNGKVSNARTTTHLGSGGVSFSPATVVVSRAVQEESAEDTILVREVLAYGSSLRRR